MESSKHADTGRDARLSASRPPGVYYELFFEKEGSARFSHRCSRVRGFAKIGDHEKANQLHDSTISTAGHSFNIFKTDPKSYLGYAVRGFFENGGEHCVVIPVQ